MLQQAEQSEPFVFALTGSSTYYNWEKYCTPWFSVHLLEKRITLVWYISCHWIISKAVLSGKHNFKKGPDWGDSQASFLLLVTELVRRAIWKMSKYCGWLFWWEVLWHFWKASIKFPLLNQQICDDVETSPFTILTEWSDWTWLPFLIAQNKWYICSWEKHKMKKDRRKI